MQPPPRQSSGRDGLISRDRRVGGVCGCWEIRQPELRGVLLVGLVKSDVAREELKPGAAGVGIRIGNPGVRIPARQLDRLERWALDLARLLGPGAVQSIDDAVDAPPTSRPADAREERELIAVAAVARILRAD